MKIKIHKLNSFETDILAYNMLNLHDEAEIKAYESRKRSEERPLTMAEIREIMKNEESSTKNRKPDVSFMKKFNSFVN